MPRSYNTPPVSRAASVGAQRSSLLTPSADRTHAILRNDDVAVAVRLGGPQDVSATAGITLAPGATLVLDNWRGELWGVSEGAAVTVTVLEAFAS